MDNRPLTAWTHNIPPAWRWAGLVWLVGRALLSFWGFAIYYLGSIPDPASRARFLYNIQPIAGGLAGPLLGVWQRWDTLHYQAIILRGYASSIELTAFFPFYPLLAGGLSRLTGLDSLAALLVISNLAFLLALVVLYQLVAQDFSPEVARRVLFAAILFPTSFFFYAGYPLSLALLFTLLAYWCARKGRWLLAALAGILAGLSHSTIIPLAALLLSEAFLQWRKTRDWKEVGKLPAALSPLMGVALFLAWRAGQGFPSLSAIMDSIWGRVVQTPWKTLLDIPRQFQTGPIWDSLYSDLLLLAIMFAAVVWGWKRLRASEWIYQVCLLLYLLITTVSGQPLASFGRYMLMGFPVFIMAGCLADKKWIKLAGLAIGLSIELILCAVFFQWGWVD